MAGKAADELKKAIVEYYKQGALEKCQAACQQLQKIAPNDIGVALKFAEVTAKIGDEGWAISIYEDAAGRCAADGNFHAAVGIYKMILKMDPTHATAKSMIQELTANDAKKEDVAMSINEPTLKTPAGGIPSSPLLDELKKENLNDVISRLKRHVFEVGDFICHEGDEGRSIYIITKGVVKIFIVGVVGEKIELAQLKGGDFFGEVAFFTDGKRRASVMALEPTEALEITKEDVELIAANHPKIRDILESFFRTRVLDKQLAVSPLFSTLKREDRLELLKHFKLVSFNKGDTLASEGEAGNSIFVIKQGRVEVSTKRDEEKIKLAELKEGDFFGEVSLITGKARTATVTALTDIEALELSKEALMRFKTKYPDIDEVLKRYMKTRMEKTICAMMQT